jgi:hypothetical protein
MKRAGLVVAIISATTGIAAAAVSATVSIGMVSVNTVSMRGDRSPAHAVYAKAAGSAPADVSSNWAGYVANGFGSTASTASAAMAYTDVTGTWTQPAATCTKGTTTSAAIWVGIGGYSQSSEKLEQAGTSADCDSKGKATYYAWYELVPADSVNITLKISPGDVITSTVLITGSDVLVQVKNRTHKTFFTKHLSMDAPDLTSAEWIVEAPALCGASFCRELKLTNFGSVTFSRTFAKGNGLGGTITSSNWMSTLIQLVPQSRRFFGDPNDPASGSSGAGAMPAGLAADGSGFNVNWQAHPTVGT